MTAVAGLRRAVELFSGQGITTKRVLSDNGSAYVSKPWALAFTDIHITAKR